MNSKSYFSGLIDRIVHYAVSAIFQPYDGGRQKLQNVTDINLCKKSCIDVHYQEVSSSYMMLSQKNNHKICVHAVVPLLKRYVWDSFE